MGDSATTTLARIAELAAYRHARERIRGQWAGFLRQRALRLQPHPLIGEPTEEITIGILEALFTQVQDWPLAEVNHEVGHADIVLTDHGIRKLIVEAKRPRWLVCNALAINAARPQARGYGMRQKVGGIPEKAIRGVLERLGRAAIECGRLSPEAASSAGVYRQLRVALDQLGISLNP